MRGGGGSFELVKDKSFDAKKVKNLYADASVRCGWALIDGGFAAAQTIYFFNGSGFDAHKTPSLITKLVPDGRGGLWLIGASSVSHRAADGTLEVFDGKNSPIGIGGNAAQEYKLNGFVDQGKLHVIVRRAPRTLQSVGTSTIVNGVYTQFQARLGTFGNTIYSYE